MDEQSILKQFAAALMAKANVVGVGIGHKVSHGRRLDNRCITVLVGRKQPLAALGLRDIVPASLGGMRTDVLEIGNLRALEQTERLRPAQPGLSISHYRVSAGTFGALVFDQATGEPLILSNNHVLANSSNGYDRRANPGDPVLQPGSYDGGNQPDDLIGRLVRYVPLSFTAVGAEETAAAQTTAIVRQLTKESTQGNLNLVDGALAAPLSPEIVNGEIIGIGTVNGTTSPELDLKLQKSGRTSGLTTGIILLQHAVLRISYGEAGTCIFTDQLVSDLASRPGDSGSLVLDMNRQAVGLLFAGSDSVTIINPIEAVLTQLKVRF